MKLTANKLATLNSEKNEYLISYIFTDDKRDVHTLEKQYTEELTKESENEIKLIQDIVKSMCEVEGTEEKYINDYKVSDRDFRNSKNRKSAKLNTKIRYEFEVTYARCIWLMLKKHGYEVKYK